MKSVGGNEPQADFNEAATPDGKEWQAYNPYDLACRVAYEMQDALAKTQDMIANGRAPDKLEKISRHLNNGAYYLGLLEQWNEALKNGEKPEAPEAALTVMASLPTDKAAIKALYDETKTHFDARNARISSLRKLNDLGRGPEGPSAR